MKQKFLKGITLIIVILCIFSSVTVVADENQDTAQELADGILEYHLSSLNDRTTQGFIDSVLTEKAGISAEWYVIALSQNGNYNFDTYEESLLEYISENKTGAAATRLKYALALVAIGNDDKYIKEELENSIAKQGIMSLVYGLHILNNGIKSENYTVDSLISEIISLRFEDGGWAISGKTSDVDVTAMTLQALAPYYKENQTVKAVTDEALTLLSSRQQEDGEFLSYGAKNPESAAQVIVALSSLGIDCKEDARFIKNGNNLLDVMLRYRTEEGAYRHISGGPINANATVQVYFACVSYLKMKQGDNCLYVFEDDSFVSETSDEIKQESTISVESNEENSENAKYGYKGYTVIGLIVLFLLIMAVLLITKKLNKKNVLLIALMFLLLIAFVLFTDFSTVDDYYEDAISKNDVAGTITVSISCEAIKSEGIPNNGVILSETECVFSNGETVYDILAEITAREKIHLETNGTGASVYIEGIGNVYEFEYGDLSGWEYFVNGERPSVSCGEYELKDGDKIEWKYTLTLGEYNAN